MLILALVIVDQLLKMLILTKKPFIKIIPGVLELVYTGNTGTVFGIFKEHNYVFVITSLIVILGIVFYYFKYISKNNRHKFLWELIIAGGIGNILDRIFRGFVVDYLYIKPFGICNFADILIVMGVVLLALLEIKNSVKEKK